LDLFLEYVGISEEEFYSIATSHQVSPWKFDVKELREGEKTPDYEQWLKGDGLSEAEAENQIGQWAKTCSTCESSESCAS